ncbi:MAG: hypothetical protein EBR99_04405 [Actinobacteria bacterium]|nr:hypothetical protein [Actinomycetota bacterium]
MRRTKIVATVGPASESDEVIQALVAAGVDVLRLSFAHGDLPSCIDRLRRVRALAPDLAIMVDIPGPKIRAGSFGTAPVTLELGSSLILEEGFGGRRYFGWCRYGQARTLPAEFVDARPTPHGR